MSDDAEGRVFTVAEVEALAQECLNRPPQQHPIRKNIQAKHIPAGVFLGAVRCSNTLGLLTRWHVQAIIEAAMGRALPSQVIRAKASRMIDSRNIDGCACGCAGGWRIISPTAAEIFQLLSEARRDATVIAETS